MAQENEATTEDHLEAEATQVAVEAREEARFTIYWFETGITDRNLTLAELDVTAADNGCTWDRGAMREKVTGKVVASLLNVGEYLTASTQESNCVQNI